MCAVVISLKRVVAEYKKVTHEHSTFQAYSIFKHQLCVSWWYIRSIWKSVNIKRLVILVLIL